MANLSKTHRDEILKLIADSETNLDQLKAYCSGAGFDVSNYSSPVHISESGKVALRYRGENTYYHKS
jgi:ADP-heptose:LPS heptosyltransferase